MKISISLPDELAAKIDAARGDVPRSVWIRRAVERALGEPEGKPLSDPMPPRSPELENPSAGFVRASSLAKRDIRPIPKGKS